MGDRLVTEIPSSLKQLARLVVRGFYTIEDALIVDMLVRNPCEFLFFPPRSYPSGRAVPVPIFLSPFQA